MKNCVRTWRQWNPLSIFLKMQWTPSETRLHLILLGKIDKEEEDMVKGCLSCPVVNKGCGACHVFIMTAHKETFLSDSMELIVQRQDKGQHCLERRWESVSTEAVPSWLLSTCSRQVHMKRASLSRPRFSDARTVSPGNPDIQVCTFRGLKKRLGSLNAASSKSHDESSRKKGKAWAHEVSKWDSRDCSVEWRLLDVDRHTCSSFVSASSLSCCHSCYFARQSWAKSWRRSWRVTSVFFPSIAVRNSSHFFP